MRKRILSLVLSVTMMVVYIPTTAVFAADAKAGDDSSPSILSKLQSGEIGGISSVDPEYGDDRLLGEELLTPSEVDISTQGSGSDAILSEETDISEITKFDLRDVGDDHKNYVTPVKFQNPFGSCWGFSVIAASETSILTKLGQSYDEYEMPGVSEDSDITDANKMDLSEHHLAWFAGNPLPENDDSGQGGEGTYIKEGADLNPMNLGGMPFYGTTCFGSGIGPMTENAFPYRPKADEEGNLPIDPSGEYYDEDGDWSIDEDYRFGIFTSGAELEESSILPSPAIKTTVEDEVEYTYNETATEAIKSELLQGRAVSIAFCADTYDPGDTKKDPKYINTETWAHYTYDAKEGINHAVTIVGWDDEYSLENFLSEEKVTGAEQPPEDGAWIVKNSWGSVENEFPNEGEWGIDGTGYFYLSYYDKSLTYSPETFEFDTSNEGTEYEYVYVNQYDYMPANGVQLFVSQGDELQMANIFTAEDGDMALRTVCCMTTAAGAEVTYEIYRLNNNPEHPMDGVRVATVSDIYQYGGYHRTNLETPVYFHEGEKYSVIVTQKVVSDDGTAQYVAGAASGINERYAKAHKDIQKYSKAVINEDESWIGEYIDGGYTWYEWKHQTDLWLGDSAEIVIDNIPIKTYSDPFECINIADAKVTANASTYTGKVVTPKLTVKVDGQTLKQGSDYKVSCTGKAAGPAKATITGIGKYKGTKTVNFVITPVAPAVKAPAKLNKGFTAKWAKTAAANATGYQVRYSLKSSMANAKIKTVKGAATTSTKVTNLKAKKKYYLQVRTYRTVNGKKYFSAWSAKKSVTTK